MEDPALKLTEKYLKFPIKFLNVFGLWRLDNNIFMYYLYAFFFLFFTQYCYAFSQIIYTCLVWGDIEKIAECSFLLLTQGTMCTKLVIFACKRTKIRSLIKFVDDPVFVPRRFHQWSIIDKSAKIQTIEFFIFIGMSLFTISLCAIFPMIEAPPNERILPFKAWYPFPNETPYFEMLYFYQLSGISLSAFINISMDRYSTAMTALGCAQVEILMDNLVNIKTFAMEDHNKAKNEVNPPSKTNNTNNDNTQTIQSDNSLIEDLIEDCLIKCILHHQCIVKFITDVEECFHLGILAQFAASVMIICITGLQLTIVDPTSLKFVTKVWYMLTMMAQVFFICRIGNDISTISAELVGSAYNCHWIDRRKRFKTTLLIFIERLKQPIVTRAGNFFPLSLETFVTLIRSSYSYFAVLQQMNNK